MSCFICRDSPQEIYKICDCQDSILCNECLVMTNTNQIIKCPICRKLLKTTISRNYYETFKLSFQYFGLKFLLYFLPLIFPIYSYYKDYDLKAITLFLTLYAVTVFEPIIIKMVITELRFKESSYTLIKILLC